jgi:hypothetical protein
LILVNEAYGNAHMAASGAVILFCVGWQRRTHGCLRNADAGRIIRPQKIILGERCHERVFTP